MSDAAINGVSDNSIYTGIWTNWSEGHIRGATITLTKRDAGLLTAFIALFVTVVGRSLWRLFCFAAHMLLSTSTAQDGLYHQKQAVLRNAHESTVGLKLFVQLAWGWRRRSEKPAVLKVLPLIGITTLLTIGVYVSSIFSSEISTVTANEVLISSPKCGLYTGPPNDEAFYTNILAYMSELTSASASYAQQCYGKNTTTQQCSIFVKKQIPQIISRNASCPFPGEKRICMRESTNLRIDTGKVDSQKHLGINAAPKDRFTYRSVVECAPLNTKAYTRIVPGADYTNSNLTVQLLYGNRTYGVDMNNSVTYEWPMYVPQGIADYMLSATVYIPADANSLFTPIADLRRDDADTTLFFLTGNGVQFSQPVDDEFFAAHEPQQVNIRLSDGKAGKREVYMFDNVIHVLGCATRHQFCYSKTSCSPLTAWEYIIPELNNVNSTEQQREAARVWSHSVATLGGDLRAIVGNLGASALLARKYFQSGIQGPLPPDQWQREVEYWQATVMARMQRVLVEYATGPSDATMQDSVEKPSDDKAQKQCKSQKVKNTSHTSFSVLGLCITFILGGLIVLAELIAEPLLRFIQRRCTFSICLYQRLEWIVNETLQLQRMAHEEIGAGTWSGTAESLPITEKGERLAILDVSDEKHPQLVYVPQCENENKLASTPDAQHSSSTEVTQLETPESFHPNDSHGNQGSLEIQDIVPDPSHTYEERQSLILPDSSSSSLQGVNHASSPSTAERHDVVANQPAAHSTSRLSGTPSPTSDDEFNDSRVPSGCIDIQPKSLNGGRLGR